MAESLTHAIEADERARATIAHELGRTLFVEAGAGTGKTSALVGRITELVLATDRNRRIPLSAIAAITFTEAAAAELRERIRIEFEERRRRAISSGDHALAELCSTALQDADSAAISTLHAFAQRLLSEFPVEVGIPPRVEVIDEVRSQVAFDDRWSRFVDELFADEDIEEFVVRGSILGVGLGSKGSQLRQVAQNFDDNWDRFDGLELTTPIAAPVDWTELSNKVRAVVETTDWCSDPGDKLLIHLLDQCVTFKRFLESQSEIDRLRLLVRIADFKPKGGQAPNWDGRKSEVGEIHLDMVEAANALKDQLANQTLTLLAGRIAHFTRTAAHERRDEGVLEFHDLLVLARQLLRQSPQARAALSTRYRVLMLDEFQDTDPIQIELALLLAGSHEGGFEGGWDDLAADPGRLFMVGDPKQSIYRFRRADIKLFLEVQEKFGDGQVALTRNFRTVEPILTVVNALFADRMPEATRAQAKYEPLVATRAPSSVDHRPVILGRGIEDSALALREAEAAEVASIIDDIVQNPDHWPVADPDVAGGWRSPRLSDITILLPTRTSLSQLTSALDDREISYRADTGTLIYETQEVRELLTVLRAIDDPSDQIAVVGALRTSLYACGDDDLLNWRTAGGDWDYRSGVPEPLQGGVVHEAMLHLRSIADRRWWDEPSQLLLRIVDERRMFAVAGASTSSRDRWRRIRYVVDQARAFAEAAGGDLRDYLRWTALQGVDGAKAHEPMLPEQDDDSVHIMTVHGSKGLEFPIAILSGLTTQMVNRRRGAEVNWVEGNPLPEVKLNSRLRTANFDLTADLEAEMDEGEKERLLYVALTRARDHLIVSGFHNPALTKAGEPRVRSHGRTIHEFSEGLGKGFVRRFEVSEQASLFGDETVEGVRTNSGFVAPARVDAGGAETLAVEPVAWAQDRAATLGMASVPRTRSATAIAASAREFADGEARAMLAEGMEPWAESDPADDLPPATFRRGRAGTAIGSAVHAVLQFVDLANPDPVEIDRLVRAQAWAESVPEHADTIAASVRSALAAPIVESCSKAEHWKELYVAAPVGDVTIEGYVDLLVEGPAGLVVVDYKTDALATEADIDAKVAGYALQGASYAVAVEVATQRPVVEVQFVFARPTGPVVRSVEDLALLTEQVRSIGSRQRVPPASLQ